MKKLILSTFIIGSFGLYVIWQGQNGTSTTFVAQPVVTQKNNPAYTPDQTYVATTPSEPAKTTQKTTTKKTSTGVVTTTPITPPLVIKKKGLYTDGTYTGSSANAYYGNVQVQAVISGGKLTDVIFLDHPQHARNSQIINSQAMPWLTQEAIQAQSANVDGVSGASYTSAAFKESLTSALNQAKA